MKKAEQEEERLHRAVDACWDLVHRAMAGEFVGADDDDFMPLLEKQLAAHGFSIEQFDAAVGERIGDGKPLGTAGRCEAELRELTRRYDVRGKL